MASISSASICFLFHLDYAPSTSFHFFCFQTFSNLSLLGNLCISLKMRTAFCLQSLYRSFSDATFNKGILLTELTRISSKRKKLKHQKNRGSLLKSLLRCKVTQQLSTASDWRPDLLCTGACSSEIRCFSYGFALCIHFLNSGTHAALMWWHLMQADFFVRQRCSSVVLTDILLVPYCKQQGPLPAQAYLRAGADHTKPV